MPKCGKVKHFYLLREITDFTGTGKPANKKHTATTCRMDIT
jgi:hypothetical protein